MTLGETRATRLLSDWGLGVLRAFSREWDALGTDRQTPEGRAAGGDWQGLAEGHVWAGTWPMHTHSSGDDGVGLGGAGQRCGMGTPVIVNNEKIEYRSPTFKALWAKRVGPQVAPRLTSWVPTLSFLSYFFNTHMRTHSLIIFIERERAGERE